MKRQENRVLAMSARTDEDVGAKLPVVPFSESYIFRENPQCRHLDEKSL
jgi:hypothetical protein